jgi:hypothetical protein
MKSKRYLYASLLFGFAITSLIAGGIYFNSKSYAQDDRSMQDKNMKEMPDLSGWPEASQLAAKEMMKKYGKPNEVTDHMLVWTNNGSWKRTKIFDKESKHMFPVDHTDVMEQTIDYKVPVDKFDELAEYDGSVWAKRTDGELSAKCDKEGANFLAINLANDIATGKKSVSEARQFYANAIKEFALNNKMSPYMQSLQFNPMKSGANDTDKHGVSEEDNNNITKKMKEMNKRMLMDDRQTRGMK